MSSRAWIGFANNKHNHTWRSGLCACISSRITTVIHVSNNDWAYYNWYNEPFAASPKISVNSDMHGLIFETSIWLLAGSTRWKAVAVWNCDSNMNHNQCAPHLGQAIHTHICCLKTTYWRRHGFCPFCTPQTEVNTFQMISTCCESLPHHIHWQNQLPHQQTTVIHKPTKSYGAHEAIVSSCKPFQAMDNKNHLYIYIYTLILCAPSNWHVITELIVGFVLYSASISVSARTENQLRNTKIEWTKSLSIPFESKMPRDICENVFWKKNQLSST